MTHEPDGLSKYLDATNGEGPLADLWKDKPHQIVSELMIHVRQLQTDNLELERLFDLQQSRVRIATKEWQKAHGQPGTIPDLGMLIDWMWGQVKVCEFLIQGQLKPGEKLEDLYCPLCGNQKVRDGS
jgi:hypothetical protein